MIGRHKAVSKFVADKRSTVFFITGFAGHIDHIATWKVAEIKMSRTIVDVYRYYFLIEAQSTLGTHQRYVMARHVCVAGDALVRGGRRTEAQRKGQEGCTKDTQR